MAGIYVHIPFCKQACYYCDFHFSTNLNTKSDLVAALGKEIELQKDFLKGEEIETIYFGGGTPSLLSFEELHFVLNELRSVYAVKETVELTIECNPDDLNPQKLDDLLSLGFNRLSIGIQSFNDKILQFFNRAHNADMARSSVDIAQKAGFKNISIDLIFGVPNQTIYQFEEDLQKAIQLNTEHVSIYGLTIEEQTVFGKWLKQNKFSPLGDDQTADQLELIMNEMKNADYLQYEISNFCKPGFESKHNSSYWSGTKYLGIGPAAHSYDGATRKYNVKNNNKYIKTIAEGVVPCEVEKLTKKDLINEAILTQVRLLEGINLEDLLNKFQFDLLQESQSTINELQKLGMISLFEKRLVLNDSGKLLADLITEKLII
jgi:oxygen-independent coproporphyrinogen-3 oxidase